MVNSSSYYLLLLIASISWIYLCCIDGSNTSETQRNEETIINNSLPSEDNSVLHLILSKGPLLAGYSLCIFLGILAVGNVAKCKWLQYIKHSLPLVKHRIDEYRSEITRLKLENDSIVNLLHQYKLEKKLYLHYLKNNSTIIQRLKNELSRAKAELDLMKCHGMDFETTEFYEKLKTTSKSIADSYFYKPKNASQVICDSVFKGCESVQYTTDQAAIENNDSDQNISIKNLLNFAQKLLSSVVDKDPEKASSGSEIRISKLGNVGIVCTEQLERLKIMASKFEPVKNYQSFKKWDGVFSEKSNDYANICKAKI